MILISSNRTFRHSILKLINIGSRFIDIHSIDRKWAAENNQLLKDQQGLLYVCDLQFWVGTSNFTATKNSPNISRKA
jgi:hypothetical protein